MFFVDILIFVVFNKCTTYVCIKPDSPPILHTFHYLDSRLSKCLTTTTSPVSRVSTVGWKVGEKLYLFFVNNGWNLTTISSDTPLEMKRFLIVKWIMSHLSVQPTISTFFSRLSVLSSSGLAYTPCGRVWSSPTTQSLYIQQLPSSVLNTMP